MPVLTSPKAATAPHTYYAQHEFVSEHNIRSPSSKHRPSRNQSPTPAPLVQAVTSASSPRVAHPRQQSFHPNASTSQSARNLKVKHPPATSTRFLTDDSKGAPTPLTETIRRPIMYQGKYGFPANWSLDPFTLPHNAIRAECVDLYNILESIHARSHSVNSFELEEFHIWWTTFDAFIIEYFDFEADVLFPWVFPAKSSSDNAPPNLPPQKITNEIHLRNSLMSKKELLLDAIRQLNGTFELRHNVDTADVFHTILDEVSDFVPKLLEYFHVQERHLPPIVERYYTAAAKDPIVKEYVQYIKKGDSPQTNLVLLSRWMDSDVKDKWLRSYVRGLTRLLHKRWERRCNKSHGHIAYKFHKRLLRSVRSVAASRLRRRTEFGEDVDDISFSSLASQTGSIRSLNLVGQSRSQQFPKSSRRSKESNKFRSKFR